MNIPEGHLGSKATGGEASGLGCTGRAPSCLEGGALCGSVND